MNSQTNYTPQGVLSITAPPLDQDSLILHSCVEQIFFPQYLLLDAARFLELMSIWSGFV